MWRVGTRPWDAMERDGIELDDVAHCDATRRDKTRFGFT